MVNFMLCVCLPQCFNFRVKFLEINVLKCVQDLYSNKTLLKGIKDHLHKCREILFSQI